MTVPVVRADRIGKSFPGVRALDNVTFEVTPGTVHALCGENGAGKSTLMKIFNGQYHADDGRVFVKGEPVDIKNPQVAHELGIAMIAQELEYVPEMTVAESFFLGRLVMNKFGVDWKAIRREAKEILAREQIDVSLDAKLRTLTVSQIQMLEIARAVHFNAEVLIMDEPTSAIAHKEVEALFEKINDLKAKGVAIIYISHKMDEVFRIADEISVLRDGKLVSTDPASALTLDEVVARMVGRPISDVYPKETIPAGDVKLEVRNLSADVRFEDITMNIRSGEIVGLAGLIGAGRSEVIRSIFGLDTLTSGEVYVEGKRVTPKNPAHMIEHGVAMLAEDRRLDGIIPILSVRINASVASLKKFFKKGRLLAKKERDVVAKYFGLMRVKTPSQETAIQSLSGGNQQKVLLAKWLLTEPKVLLLDEPTRGVDVGAKTEIYKLMTELARQGQAILMISSELPELIGMCDRIYVMSQGRQTAELQREDFSQETILKYAIQEVD